MIDTTPYMAWIEWTAVITGLLFIVLMISENIWTWAFGIVSSALFVYIMYVSQLYSESLLYVVYVIIGVYGWYKWSDKSKGAVEITTADRDTLIIIIVTGIVLTLALGTLMKQILTDSFSPYCDAFTSVFGLIASYMEAQKWVSSWLFWIVINAVSIWLYMSRELNISSILMFVYFVLSIAGFFAWRKKYFSSKTTKA